MFKPVTCVYMSDNGTLKPELEWIGRSIVELRHLQGSDGRMEGQTDKRTATILEVKSCPDNTQLFAPSQSHDG